MLYHSLTQYSTLICTSVFMNRSCQMLHHSDINVAQRRNDLACLEIFFLDLDS